MKVQAATYRREVKDREVSDWALTAAQLAVEEHLAMQKPGELAAFVDFLRETGPPLQQVLEIGGMHGGTAWLWSQLVEGDQTRVVVVDQFVLEGRMEHAGPHVMLVNGDSHLPKTRDSVFDRFPECAVDLLFIDGDHSYAGVRQDFGTYRPLVRSGGIIALHDTAVPHENVAEHDVIPFWLEVCTQFEHVEFFDPDPGAHWGGIGALVMP